MWRQTRSGHTSDSHRLQFDGFSSFLFFKFGFFFFFNISRVQNITNEQFLYSSNVIYKKLSGLEGGGVLQICSTVHIIAILRIYRRSLINSNKWGKLWVWREREEIEGGGGREREIVRDEHFKLVLPLLAFTTAEWCIAPNEKQTKTPHGSRVTPKASSRGLRNFHGHCVLGQTVQCWLVLFMILPAGETR